MCLICPWIGVKCDWIIVFKQVIFLKPVNYLTLFHWVLNGFSKEVYRTLSFQDQITSITGNRKCKRRKLQRQINTNQYGIHCVSGVWCLLKHLLLDSCVFNCFDLRKCKQSEFMFESLNLYSVTVCCLFTEVSHSLSVYIQRQWYLLFVCVSVVKMGFQTHWYLNIYNNNWKKEFFFSKVIFRVLLIA